MTAPDARVRLATTFALEHPTPAALSTHLASLLASELVDRDHELEGRLEGDAGARPAAVGTGPSRRRAPTMAIATMTTRSPSWAYPDQSALLLIVGCDGQVEEVRDAEQAEDLADH
jgi:hypothetical protein